VKYVKMKNFSHETFLTSNTFCNTFCNARLFTLTVSRVVSSRRPFNHQVSFAGGRDPYARHGNSYFLPAVNGCNCRGSKTLPLCRAKLPSPDNGTTGVIFAEDCVNGGDCKSSSMALKWPFPAIGNIWTVKGGTVADRKFSC